MKKLVLTFLMFCVPAMAVMANLQQDDEAVLRGVLNSPVGRLSKHHAAMKLDYISYQISSGDTVFSQIVQLENKYKSASDDDLNLKYLKKLKDLYMFTASYDDKDSMSAAFLEEFNRKRIVIPDNEYRGLDEELKVLLAAVNVYN